MACSAHGKKPFMSATPKPNSEPSSRCVSSNGSVCHASRSKGTVSVCPEKTRPPGWSSGPSVAIRFALCGAFTSGTTSTRKPRSSQSSAKWSTTERLLWSKLGSGELTEGLPTRVRRMSTWEGNVGMLGIVLLIALV